PRAGVVRPAEARILGAAYGENMFNVTERLHVVDDSRTHVETQHRREIRRLDPWITAFPLERFDQTRFLAANVGARAAVDIELNPESGPNNILAKEIVLARFLDRALEDFGALGKFAADIDVRGMRIKGVTRDQHSFEQLVRILVDDVAVFECARLGFVGVADQIHWPF